MLQPKSATTAVEWGYPLGGPRSSVLFSSRRSRRHRLLARQLQTAMTQLRLREQVSSGASGYWCCSLESKVTTAPGLNLLASQSHLSGVHISMLAP